MKLASKVFETKLSLENQLKLYCNLEKIKLLCLNQEQIDLFEVMPNFKIESHLNEIKK